VTAFPQRIVARASSWFSDPNPILVKELRATFRTNLFVRFLYLCTGLVALLVLGVGATAASGDVPPATVGEVVFQLFMGTALFVISLVAPGYASASLTAEKEQQTWESLELSGMSPWRVVLGKFAACYASIALVLVALSPVVGIAFLFGGVSPWQVLVGFLSLLLVLAPAIAAGVAISARLSSTRVAIVLVTFLYFPLASFTTGIVSLFAEAARSNWGTGAEGPFFYAEVLVTRAGEWDTWAFLVGVPLYAFGLRVWFLLATAVAGVRPAAEDRARALKVWAIAMTLTSALVGALCVLGQSSAEDASEMALVVTMFGGPLYGFYGLLFMNDPPLPPRPWELRRASLPAWRRALGVLGPGAAGTLRFAIVHVVLSAAAICGAALATRYLAFGSPHIEWEESVAGIVYSIGTATIAASVAAIGGWFRVVLRHGLAARVLTLALYIAFTLVPLLAALIVDTESFDQLDDRSPLPVRFSVIEPMLIAIQTADSGSIGHALWIVVPATIYGGLALLFWILVELFVRKARVQSDARRARFAAMPPPASIVPARRSRPTPAPAAEVLATAEAAATADAVATTAPADTEAAPSSEGAPSPAAPSDEAPSDEAPSVEPGSGGETPGSGQAEP
jgi:ABC-type transport system involved in multi-copper enzyme maturation permease subunit